MSQASFARESCDMKHRFPGGPSPAVQGSTHGCVHRIEHSYRKRQFGKELLYVLTATGVRDEFRKQRGVRAKLGDRVLAQDITPVPQKPNCQQ